MASNGQRIEIMLRDKGKWVSIGRGRPSKAFHDAMEFGLKHYYLARNSIRAMFWKLITDPDWKKYPLDSDDLGEKYNEMDFDNCEK